MLIALHMTEINLELVSQQGTAIMSLMNGEVLKVELVPLLLIF